MDIVKLYALALALAFTTESGVEYIFGQLVDHIEALGKFRWALMYISLAAGIGLSLYYRLDMMSAIGGSAPSTVSTS